MATRIYRMRNAVYCCAGGLLFLNVLPHTFPNFPIKSGLGWRDAEPPDELVDHVRKIAAVMGLPHPEKLRVFFTKGLTSMAFGSTLLPKGAAIGLPRTVMFREEEDVRNSYLAAAGQPIDWNSMRGHRLAHALIPSAWQINFVIAHEVSHLKHKDWLPRVVLPPVTLVVGYHLARAIPHHTARRHILAGFAVIMAASLAVHLQVTATIAQKQELRADQSAAACRPSYAEGGREHFEKRIIIDSVMESAQVSTPLDRFKTTFSTHPPSHVRLERIHLLAVRMRDKTE